MPKTFVFLIIGLFFGTGFGFLITASSGAALKGHDHAAGGAAHDHAAHDHGNDAHVALTEAGTPVPALTLMLHPDGAQSRNLHIGVTNFTFAPEAVNGVHVPGQGHAHVYMDGVKLGRAYAPWYHLSALHSGAHEIRVTLNANDHSALAIDGQPVEATAKLVIE